MVKVTQVADDGTETASIVVDDFTIEVIYSGLADLLRQAASHETGPEPASGELSRQERQRRDKILTRLRS